MAANEDRAASVILLCRKQASTWKTEVSAWRRISEWLFLKLKLLSNYRANCWDQNRFSSWDPMDHSQQAASPRALSHDTSFLASKFCTYTRSPERLCPRHLTVFFSSGTPHMFKAFIATPPQSPVPPFFPFFVWSWLIIVEKERIVGFVSSLVLSVRSSCLVQSEVSPVCRQSASLANLCNFTYVDTPGLHMRGTTLCLSKPFTILKLKITFWVSNSVLWSRMWAEPGLFLGRRGLKHILGEECYKGNYKVCWGAWIQVRQLTRGAVYRAAREDTQGAEERGLTD